MDVLRNELASELSVENLYFISGVIGLITIIYAIWKIFFASKLIDASNLAVFISGCDTGLGKRLAIYFDSLGCDVFAGCLVPNASRRKLPETVTVIPLDVCKEDSVNEAVAAVKKILNEKGKDLWALVNNAGVCVYGQFEWQTWDHCLRQVDVNFVGTMRMIRAFLPLLRKSKGRLVTVTSVNGSFAYPGLSVYSATKFALEGLHHALRLELRRQHGIRVVLVQPGDFARLTSIMSRHEANVEEMWDAMPQQDRLQFGDYFRKYHEAAMRNYGLTSPRSIEDSPLLGHMRDAVLSDRPKARYLSAGLPFSWIYRFLALMPLWFADGLFEKVIDALAASDRDD